MTQFPQLQIIALSLFFFMISYVCALVIIRVLKAKKHLTKFFMIFLVLSPVHFSIYNLMFFNQIFLFSIEIFYIFVNYMLFMLCYIGIHSGIELTSPTMSLLLNLRKNPLSEKDSLELMHKVSNSRLTHLKNSFLINQGAQGAVVSKLGKIILKVFKVLDTI
jgi:hypothetical protein